MFFKLIDNQTIEKAPRPLHIEGKDVFTTNEEIHNEHGFYRVVNAEEPTDDKAYRPIYTMGEGAITQEWEELTVSEVAEV